MARDNLYNRMVLTVIRTAFRLAYTLRGGSPRPRPDGKIRNVLLISTTGLGDTVMSTPAMAAARTLWPEARIQALLHRRWASLLTASPRLDGIIVYPGKFKGVPGLLRRLRAIEPDLVFILHGNDPDIFPLAWLSRTSYLVGPAASRLAFLADRAVSCPDAARHYVERRLDMLRAAAGPVSTVGEEIFLPRERTEWAREYWRKTGLRDLDRLVALNPGGSHPAKRWPEEHWRTLTRMLLENANLRLALFGSPAERGVMEGILRGLDAGRVYLVDRSDILETAALLNRADVLVGPDSGLAHVAVGLNRPALILFGPDRPELSGPLLNNAPARVIRKDADTCPRIGRCRRKHCPDTRCMAAIAPKEVYDELRTGFLPLDLA